MNICAECRYVLPDEKDRYGGRWRCAHPRHKRAECTNPITGKTVYEVSDTVVSDDSHPPCRCFNTSPDGGCSAFEPAVTLEMDATRPDREGTRKVVCVKCGHNIPEPATVSRENLENGYYICFCGGTFCFAEDIKQDDPTSDILEMVDDSYALVVKGLKKALRQELESMDSSISLSVA